MERSKVHSILFIAAFTSATSLHGCGGGGSGSTETNTNAATDTNNIGSEEYSDEDAEASGCTPLSGDSVYYVDKNSLCGSCDDNLTLEENSIETPWCTINSWISDLGAGDKLVVKAGTYFESITLPSGTAGSPFILKAYPNEKVILNGARLINGWSNYQGNIYTATIDWEPNQLFVGDELQTLARIPNDGYWSATSVSNPVEDETTSIITDTVNLPGFNADISGADIFIWASSGERQYTMPAEGINPQSAQISFTRTNQWLNLTDGDRYWIQNQPSLIDQPGEWAVVENGQRFQIYFWPNSIQDLQETLASYETRAIIYGNNADNTVIDGFEIIASGNYGIRLYGGDNLTVTKCISHHNFGHGISLRNLTNSTASKNISHYNSFGISNSYSENMLIEMNDIGYNYNDGLTVTHSSNNVTVDRNYIHHHTLWGHPDNMQTYRTVTNLTISNNLLVSGGQNIMMEETNNVNITGNTIIGSNSMSIISGHGNTDNVTIANNTITQCRYGCILFTGNTHDVRENIFLGGDSDIVYTVPEGTNYNGSDNLFYTSDYMWNQSQVILHALGQWNLTLDEFSSLTSQDQNSIATNPLLTNLPAYYSVIDTSRNQEMDYDTIFLAYETENFDIGDIIELNFDGVARTITAKGDHSITFTPELESLTFRELLVSNWKDNSNLQLNVTPLPESQALSMGATNDGIGSMVDIQAYQNGDFDMDGERDIPEWN